MNFLLNSHVPRWAMLSYGTVFLLSGYKIALCWAESFLRNHLSVNFCAMAFVEYGWSKCGEVEWDLLQKQPFRLDNRWSHKSPVLNLET